MRAPSDTYRTYTRHVPFLYVLYTLHICIIYYNHKTHIGIIRHAILQAARSNEQQGAIPELLGTRQGQPRSSQEQRGAAQE